MARTFTCVIWIWMESWYGCWKIHLVRENKLNKFLQKSISFASINQRSKKYLKIGFIHVCKHNLATSIKESKLNVVYLISSVLSELQCVGQSKWCTYKIFRYMYNIRKSMTFTFSYSSAFSYRLSRLLPRKIKYLSRTYYCLPFRNLNMWSMVSTSPWHHSNFLSSIFKIYYFLPHFHIWI